MTVDRKVSDPLKIFSWSWDSIVPHWPRNCNRITDKPSLPLPFLAQRQKGEGRGAERTSWASVLVVFLFSSPGF